MSGLPGAAATRAAAGEPVARPVRLLRLPLAGREEVGRDTCTLHFEAPELAAAIQPGQFVMLGLHPMPAPAFLKRPFSVADAADGRLTFLLRCYGSGTAEMARRRLGDVFELLGPFGRGFRIAAAPRRVVMVAGGVGLAPFYLLARRLKELPAPPETVLVYGERNAATVTRGVERFQAFDRVLLVTEDGSCGQRGNAVDGLRELARAEGLAGARLCACGPRRMLEALEVERESLEEGAAEPRAAGDGEGRAIPAEYSLEERMGCGFGICQGCVIPANPARSERAYHLLCRAGPVLDPDLVLWPHQALP